MDSREIITERLRIRPFFMSDLEDVKFLIRDKMASELSYTDHQWPTDDESIGGVLEYFSNAAPWGWCAVEKMDTGRVIGFVCADANGETERSLGYTIRSDYQKNGYAFEACRALMNHCVENLNTVRFVSGTADCNAPSVRLLAKLGFKKFESIEGSFTKDADGNPIKFAAGHYEWLKK